MVDRARDRTPRRRAQKLKYDHAHEQLRRTWAPLVSTGAVACWRCGESINPAKGWHLGHRPGQQSAPECVYCNLLHSNEHKGTP